MDRNEQDCSGEYRISGIAELPGARRGGKYLLVPRNRDRACLGAPESPPSDGTTEEGQVSDKKAVVAAVPVPHPFSSLRHEDGRLDGYVIHSRCWTLMEKHIGSQAMARLDIVVSALHEQWDRILDCLQRQPRDFPWAYRDFLDYQDWQYRGFHACDPLHIPAINKIFQTSVSSRTRQKKKDVAKIPVRRSRGVPTELIYHIAEYLEVIDARSMSIAFGESLPGSYWRKRISDIFTEVENIDPDRIDWSYLAVMLNTTMTEDMFELKAINDPQIDLSVRLWNRRRIINMLHPVKQRVLQEMRSQVERPWHGNEGDI